MALWSNVTAYLIDGKTNVSVSMATADFPTAQQFMQSIPKNGGFFDSGGNYYPASAILKISVQ